MRFLPQATRAKLRPHILPRLFLALIAFVTANLRSTWVLSHFVNVHAAHTVELPPRNDQILTPYVITVATHAGIALSCAILGAILWYRLGRVQVAFTFTGLSLIAVPSLSSNAQAISCTVSFILLTTPLWSRASNDSNNTLRTSSCRCRSPSAFLFALTCFAAGGPAFMFGLAVSVGPGNFGRNVTGYGELLLYLAAVTNTTASTAGFVDLIRNRCWQWWFPFTCIGSCLTLYAVYAIFRL